MKLIYISHWRVPSEKTMSPLIMRTCSEFAKQGAEVELWVPHRRNPAFRNVDPFTYHSVPRNFSLRFLPVLDVVDVIPGGFLVMVMTFNIAVFWYALIRGIEAKVFYLHDQRDGVLLALFRPNMILEIHDFYLSRIDWINRWVFGRAFGFVVTNRIKMNTLSERYGIPKERMLYAPNAVDTEMFGVPVSKEEARKRLGIAESGPIALYTGHLFSWKGTDTLREAARFLPDWTIYFVGGTDRDIASFRERAKGAANVKIIGRRPHAEMPLWQQAADILVLPNTAKEEASKYETSPVKLFEYMASGVPIVASDLPSIRDIVGENEVQFFMPDDSRSLSEALQSVLKDSAAAESRSKAARAKALTFSWTNRVLAVKTFLEQS